LLQFTLGFVVIVVGAGVTVQPLLLFSSYFVLIAFSDSSETILLLLLLSLGRLG